MIRLFLDCPFATQKIVPLDDKVSHYLLHVMRCVDQNQILCFNGQDGEWAAQLKIQGKKQASLFLQKQVRPQEVPPYCALCPALIKKDNMDLVLQKAAELGVTDIYPLLTDHVAHAHFNQDHAELIIREAAEQCERLTLPVLHEPMPLSAVLKHLPADCTCFCLSERDQKSDFLSATGKAAFFVGPEGGWSGAEKQFFTSHAFVALHFDVGILRAETASIAILSCWQIGRKLYLKK